MAAVVPQKNNNMTNNMKYRVYVATTLVALMAESQRLRKVGGFLRTHVSTNIPVNPVFGLEMRNVVSF